MHAMEGDERQLCISLANYFPQLFYVFLRFILVKAIEEMANIQPSWTCLVNKNAQCNEIIYLVHIKLKKH